MWVRQTTAYAVPCTGRARQRHAGSGPWKAWRGGIAFVADAELFQIPPRGGLASKPNVALLAVLQQVATAQQRRFIKAGRPDQRNHFATLRHHVDAPKRPHRPKLLCRSQVSMTAVSGALLRWHAFCGSARRYRAIPGGLRSACDRVRLKINKKQILRHQACTLTLGRLIEGFTALAGLAPPDSQPWAQTPTG